MCVRDKGGKGQHCRSIDRASVSVIDIGGMLVFAAYLLSVITSDIAAAYQFDLKGSCSRTYDHISSELTLREIFWLLFS